MVAMCAAVILYFLVGRILYAQARSIPDYITEDENGGAMGLPRVLYKEGINWWDKRIKWDYDRLPANPHPNAAEPPKIWVPVVPRRVFPEMWHSVMNPDIFEANELSKKDGLLVINRGRPALPGTPHFTYEEVIQVLKKFIMYREIIEPQLWYIAISLVYWLSNEIPKNGFRTIFPQHRNELYAAISKERTLWIIQVTNHVNWLLFVIAVVHHQGHYNKKYTTEYYRSTFVERNGKSFMEHYGCTADCKHYENYRSWLNFSVENFGYWEMHYHNLFHYLKEYVYMWYDIFTASLFDIVAPIIKHHNLKNGNYTPCTLGIENKFRISGFPLNSRDWEEQLDHFLRYWSTLAEMAETFFTCKVKNTCTFKDPQIIQHGHSVVGDIPVTVLPDLIDCWFNCSDFRNVSDKGKDYLYWSAALTTIAGHTFAPLVTEASLEKRKVSWYDYYEVKTTLVPRIVQKYIHDYQYKNKRCLTLVTPTSNEKRIRIHKEVLLFKNGSVVERSSNKMLY